MAAFGIGTSRQLQGRGGSPGFRFTLYTVLSVVVMFMDQRHAWLERARYVLTFATYPIQLAVNSPTAAWHWVQESFETRDALQAENRRLREKQRDLEIRTLRYEALARENDELRGLRDALPPVADRWIAAEIVNIQLNSLRQRILINRGTTNGIFKGQAVLDDAGLIGQTTHVGPFSAEVILITDAEHAVPVQVERTGLRTIAVGAGDKTSLALPYLPANADIKTGDLLVSSGLGGVFPAGYPVATVVEVHRDAVQPLAQVRATARAKLDTDREVVLVWFRPDHPAAPVANITDDLKSGNAALQPRLAPPKPKPASPAAPGAPAANVPRPTSNTTGRSGAGGTVATSGSAASSGSAGSPGSAGTPTSPGAGANKAGAPKSGASSKPSSPAGTSPSGNEASSGSSGSPSSGSQPSSAPRAAAPSNAEPPPADPNRPPGASAEPQGSAPDATAPPAKPKSASDEATGERL